MPLLDELLGEVNFAKNLKEKTLASSSEKMLMSSSNMKIVLRRTQGPLDGCIAFHPDGHYATRTLQITLNGDNEYKGGRICFYSPDVGLHIPTRPSGTVTIHKREQLHGVTRLISGRRYALFVVDGNNGLGEKGVFHLDKSTFDALKPSKVSKT